MASNPTPGTAKASAWFKIHDEFSERAVALTFAEAYEAKWRFNTDDGTWLEWVGTHWARNRKHQILEAIGHMTARLAKGFFKAQRITEHVAIKFQSQRIVAAIENICRSLPQFTITSAALDADDFIIGTPIGTICLRTGELFAAEPEDYITTLTAVAPAPPGTPCPDWHSFLDKVTGDDRDLQRTLQQFAGDGATGSTRDQRILFLYGPGRNGKGVYCRTIAGVLGDYAGNAPDGLFMDRKGGSAHPTELVRSMRFRTLLASEIPEGSSWNEARVKLVTGGDGMEVRGIAENFRAIVPRCSVTIQGNIKPEFKTVDEALRERFMLATFPVVIPAAERVPDLERILISKEGPAILRWVIDGAVDREKNGLHVADIITVDTKEYMDEEDAVSEFLECVCEWAPAGTNHLDLEWVVETRVLYRDFGSFCHNSGYKLVSQRRFTGRMRALGVEYRNANSKRVFIRIRSKLGLDI